MNKKCNHTIGYEETYSEVEFISESDLTDKSLRSEMKNFTKSFKFYNFCPKCGEKLSYTINKLNKE